MTTVYQKLVEYDRETGDYAAYLDGDIVGWYATRGNGRA